MPVNQLKRCWTRQLHLVSLEVDRQLFGVVYGYVIKVVSCYSFISFTSRIIPISWIVGFPSMSTFISFLNHSTHMGSKSIIVNLK